MIYRLGLTICERTVLQAENFQPSAFEGRLTKGETAGTVMVEMDVTAPSVTVFAAHREKD
jgi:hypothetical protein